MIRELVSNLLSGGLESALGIARRGNVPLFNEIIDYEGVKRTFLRSLNSEVPVHILLVGPTSGDIALFSTITKSVREIIPPARKIGICNGE
jgi:hypothetical protein